jgi:uracil-DNA glycosylase
MEAKREELTIDPTLRRKTSEIGLSGKFTRGKVASLTDTIESFVDSLAQIEPTPNAYNPWWIDDPYSAIRRQNLRLYLEAHQRLGTKVLLIGEAPGYLGCRRSGVIFTSDYLLVHGVPSLDMLGEERGYQRTGEFAEVRREQSATIVWETLSRFQFLPLLWAAFPFHPHKPGQPLTNRPPTAAELVLGRKIYERLIALFPIETIVAIGNHAHKSLAISGRDVPKIRHPAQGGKNEFVAGIAELVGSLNRSS